MTRADDVRLGRSVAIKELRQENAGGQDLLLREALLTAKLQHPGVVPIYDAGYWPDGTPFYAMKLVEGRTLAAVAALAGGRAERVALLPHVIAIADTIAYAHSRGVVHGDIKPSNVVVGAFGETVVLDWGLAHSTPGADPLDASDRGTGSGAVGGTPGYMSPEQERGDAIDARADVYAIGATLHHVLAGAPPGEAPLPALAPDLRAILDKALAPDAAQRYADAGELVADLRRFQAGQLVGAHRYSLRALLARWVRRHSGVVIVAGALSAALAALAVYTVHNAVASQERDAERTRALTLLQAQSSLASDAAQAIAWLKTVRPGPHLGSEQLLAIAARSRGVARKVWRVHSNRIHALAVSPDRRWIATAGRDRTAKLLDRTNGHVTELAGHTDAVLDIGFDGGGRRVATASADGTARVWDLAGKELWRVKIRDVFDGKLALGIDDVMQRVALLDDGRTLLTVDRVGHIARAVQGERPVRLGDHGAIIAELAVAPSGAVAATRGNDGSVLLTAIADGAATRLDAARGGARGIAWLAGDRLATTHEDRVIVWSRAGEPLDELATATAVTCIAGNGERLLIGDAAGTVRIWRPRGAPRVLAGPVVAITDLAAIDGERLVAGGPDGTVRIYDLALGVVSVLRGHDGPTVHVSAVPGALLSAGVDGTVRLWPPDPPAAIIRGVGAAARAVAFETEGPVAVGREDGVVELIPGSVVARTGAPVYDVAVSHRSRRVAISHGDMLTVVGLDGEVIRALSLAERVHFLTWSHDGSRLAVSTEGDRVRVFGSDGQLQRELRMAGNVKARLAFTPGGALATAGWDGTVRLWNVDTQESRLLGRHEGPALGVAVSADGRRIASVGSDGRVVVYDPHGGGSRLLGRRDAPLYMLAFTPDGRALLTAGSDVAVAVWDLGGGAPRLLRGHTDSVALLTVAPDGQRAATAAFDGTFRVWDLESGEGVALDNAPRDPVAAIWIDGGARLLTAGRDGTVRSFEMGTPRDARAFRALLDELTNLTLER